MAEMNDARWRLRTPEERKAYEAAQRKREAFEEYKNHKEG